MGELLARRDGDVERQFVRIERLAGVRDARRPPLPGCGERAGMRGR
jgi:hypothetical protein